MAISVIITSFNDQENIKECIDSAKLLTADVFVYDLKSADETAQIAQKSQVKVINENHFAYVELIREKTVKETPGDWVLLLDTDERLTEDQAREIKKTLKNTHFSHFKIPRKNIFGRKKWLKQGGWWPDEQIRLINKKYFVSWPKEIHSTPIINGQLGFLKNPLLHYFHGDFASMVEKTIKFEDIESDLLYKAGRKVSTATFLRKFLGELYRRLIKNRGFLDGPLGIIESIYQAFSKTITWIFLYEKRKKSRSL